MRNPQNRPLEPLDHEPEAVTYARRKAGLTKRETARRCGISEQLMGDIERGRRNATPATLKKLSAVLNCPIVVLERKRTAAVRPADGSGDAA
ncbi:helix-turn-helix transcriptional regulator [Streptomyces rimosus]|uniref:helix-turn-helix domain-containing protein n=1 Tax=Streptomyces rimosus TaxID=1927 RepID=UPI0031CEA4D4